MGCHFTLNAPPHDFCPSAPCQQSDVSPVLLIILAYPWKARELFTE